jgi:hypothetical protein
MDIHKILVDLGEQRDRLEEAIVALEKFALRQSPRRGRPPKWLAAGRSDPVNKSVSVHVQAWDRASGGV